MATAEEVVRHTDFDPDDAEILIARGPRRIEIVDPDPTWPATFAVLATRIRDAVGPAVLDVEHVGSTSVAGLPAKPIIDIDLTVADPADEPAYAPGLEAAGFQLVAREPGWHQHRLFESAAPPAAFVHVFGPDCPETIRHRMLREWLREHPDDRDAYAAAKRAAGAEVNEAGGRTMMEYNQAKEPYIRDLLDRIFRAHGLL